jgi:S1-C subfamily serine protease
MISSQTGSYVGYSFAIPSNITRKIIEDIMEFGNVQRGILGVEGGELNSATSKELGIKETEGFYVKRVNKNTGAEKSGLIKGDIIIKIDSQNVTSYAELNGYISTKRPNDQVQVTIIRNNKTMVIPVTLTKSDVINTQFKGLDLENISSSDKKKFRISYGVKIKEINNDKLSAYANDLKGGIILSIGNSKAIDVETVSKALSNIDENQAVQIEMITANGQVVRLIL